MDTNRLIKALEAAPFAAKNSISNFRNKVNAFATYLDQGKSNQINQNITKFSGRSELLREYSLETD